jgi:hypothetical protein
MESKSMKYLIRFSVLFLICFCHLSLAQSRFQGGFSTQKQGNKTQSRWTIADYLLQKKSVQLMDHWLALNSSANLFEVFIGGGPLTYTYKSTTGGVTTSQSKTSQSYRLATYISIFGIEADYEQTDHDIITYSGAVALRLLGTSNQATHLTAKYGMQKRIDESSTPHEEWSNQFAEGTLNVYLVEFLGIQGTYRYYFPDESSIGTDLKGNRTSAGAFIDIGLLRLYGEYFQEKLNYDSGTNITEREREGWEYGARFYF